MRCGSSLKAQDLLEIYYALLTKCFRVSKNSLFNRAGALRLLEEANTL